MPDFSPEASNDAASPQLSVEEAITNLRGTDLSLRYYAAWWLGKFRVSSKAVVDALIEALEDEADRTELGGYPLRRNAARALGKLGDRRAVPGLIRCLECSDFYVREAAAQSLEILGDPAAVPPLMQLIAGGVAAAERVPGRPHLQEPCEAVMEALGTLKATEAIPLIQPFLEHPTKRVQYAATRAMYQLKGDDVYGRPLMDALQGKDVVLRRVALSDLGAIGYLPAAEAIATAPVESSFKLIALKGLLEHQLDPALPNTLSPDAIRVMNLMDSLL
ncbi:MAG: HEAT repeat domain-containing protein [Coleofasciculus sp. C3-bin4]|nr:HEAT repeat domain-containing protein [Coleofasciculus sp. C3-bin4]